MKLKIFCITLTLMGLFISCSKDNERLIVPTSIEFVHEDGSSILVGECINPNENYAILIKTSTTEEEGSYVSITLDFTVNGFLYNMTFMRDGMQKIPISLIDGQNTAQIISTDYSCEISCAFQGDFELVE